MSVQIVIGKNFGDEGKGLAIDFFAYRSLKAGRPAVCVRHNGGAQAGHTVDLHDKRFVFSQLSSASFRGADTYWADSFLPDLYKLSAETESFRSLNGTIPQIFASSRCRCTYIGDILVNMLLETARGKKRHGSCGMGINEAVVRSAAFPLYLGDVIELDAAMLYQKLRILHQDYLPLRLKELGIDLRNSGEYGELLQSDAVLHRAAEEMARNTAMIQLRDAAFLKEYDDILFEGAQGLLLDEFYTKYAPHLTTSRTGLCEPARILRNVFAECEIPKTEIVYVTRSYVTRHGAGPLPCENHSNLKQFAQSDRTNIPNEWQGTLRTAPHGDPSEFTEAVRDDLSESNLQADAVLFVTHLNESNGCIITKNGSIPVDIFCNAAEIRELFSRIYRSDSPYAEDVCSFAIT